MTNSVLSTVDNQRYLEMLQEFEILRLLPENEKYLRGTRGVDYVGLVIAAVAAVSKDFVPEGHPDRIVYLHSQLTNTLEPATYLELCALKLFLEKHNYCMTVVRDHASYTVTIQAQTFDFVVLVD